MRVHGHGHISISSVNYVGEKRYAKSGRKRGIVGGIIICGNIRGAIRIMAIGSVICMEQNALAIDFHKTFKGVQFIGRICRINLGSASQADIEIFIRQ